MAVMLTKHLSSLIGAVVAIASVLSLLASKSVKSWARGHGYLILIILIAVVVTAFIVTDFLLNRKSEQAAVHDRQVVADILHALPPDGPIIVWLKDSFISSSVPIRYAEGLEGVFNKMRLNVVGLDNSQANEVYGKLRDAIYKFIYITTYNLFSNQDHTAAVKSPEWPYEKWSKVSDEINEACMALISAYDEFLRVCHKNHLD